MLMTEIKLHQIIERKIKYIQTDSVYASNDLKNVKDGELKAYEEIMNDIFNMSEKDFTDKYLQILSYLDKKTKELSMPDEIIELEKLSGYNNAIVSTLSLLNPKYEFTEI